MSTLCPASTALLELSDYDLTYLSSKTERKPLCRKAGVKLSYVAHLTASSDGLSGSLKLPEWSADTSSPLCSRCNFCLLLQNGVRQALDDAAWPWIKIHALTGGNGNGNSVEVNVMADLENLAWVRDNSPWADGQEILKTWNVHVLSLSGRVFFGIAPRYEEVARTLRDDLVGMKVEIEFELFAEPENPVARLLNVHRRPLDMWPLTERNVSSINRWMIECERDHEWCSAHSLSVRTGKQAPFLPTRLLDVGSLDGVSEPRLVLRDDHFDTACLQKGVHACRYIALSYCWGPQSESSRLLKTTRATLQDRLLGLEFSTMPHAFRDAVTVARTLNIQYLWIDSLCIIQDDLLDWEVESSRMADIFSHAHLTVVAAVGSSCHDSFLFRDPISLSCSVKIRSETFNIEDGEMGLRSRRSKGTDKMSEIVDSKWIKRGWTFQEERLARRVLIFGKNKFFLDCRTLERVEDTEYCRLRPDWVGSVCGIPEEEGNGAVRAERFSLSRSSSDHWQTLCSHYSYRELTYDSDKLPAISGIASKFSKKLGGEYLAGLWKAYLAHDLFWYAPSRASRPPMYRAPSWSWASVDRKIFYPFWKACNANECEMYCTILDAQVTVKGLDPFGAVDAGFLKIRGFVLEVRVIGRQISERKASLPQWSFRSKGREIASATLDTVGAGEEERRGPFWALLFARCKGGEGRDTARPQARGLLLERCGDVDGFKAFSRVGVFHVLQDLDEHLGPALTFWNREGEDGTILIV